LVRTFCWYHPRKWPRQWRKKWLKHRWYVVLARGDAKAREVAFEEKRF
jgi:hypothetical protein